jgi:hypothetical protein
MNFTHFCDLEKPSADEKNIFNHKNENDMDSTAGLLWSVLFSSFGMGFFMYGKKQKSSVPFVCGVALMIYPYFVTNTLLLILIGVLLIITPYFVKI